MFVGCWKCGKKLEGKSKDIPRVAYKDGSGWKSTISVCKNCYKEFFIKHPNYKEEQTSGELATK